MKVFRSILTATLAAASLAVAPVAGALAQNSNPGNSGGGHSPVAAPNYGSDQGTNPAQTTGSRYSVTPDTPVYENPTVPGATGRSIVKGDNSTISQDRRGTVQQKTGGAASDAPG